MEELRAELVAQVKKEMGIEEKQSFSGKQIVVARDRLVLLLEKREDVCSRDLIRIAHAWAIGRPTPKNWRRS